MEELTWKKFAKTFYRHANGKVRGVNLRMVQDGLNNPWRVQTKHGEPWSFGPFELATEKEGRHIEIHYGRGSEGLSPLRRLRDPLRRLDAEGDLLLGMSLVDVGFGRRLATPSWFLLERDEAPSGRIIGGASAKNRTRETPGPWARDYPAQIRAAAYPIG